MNHIEREFVAVFELYFANHGPRIIDFCVEIFDGVFYTFFIKSIHAIAIFQANKDAYVWFYYLHNIGEAFPRNFIARL